MHGVRARILCTGIGGLQKSRSLRGVRHGLYAAAFICPLTDLEPHDLRNKSR